jgi:hypothetical protein
VGYRLPSDERLVEAVEEALVRHPIVDSQRALADHVRAILHEADPDYRVSGERVRRVAVREGLAEVRVETGTTDEDPRDACPVCETELEAVENRTLDGGRTVVGTRCPACGYSTGARHEVPLRYEFNRAEAAGSAAEGPF